MISHLQLMARGVAVAAQRLRHDGIDPTKVDAASALAVLQFHDGPIGIWATQCGLREFDAWIRMWNAWQWMSKWESRRETA